MLIVKLQKRSKSSVTSSTRAERTARDRKSEIPDSTDSVDMTWGCPPAEARCIEKDESRRHLARQELNRLK
jgi:hypothetical protein